MHHSASSLNGITTPVSVSKVRIEEEQVLSTPSTLDFGSSANSVDCSSDSIAASEGTDHAHNGDVYTSFFEKPEAAVEAGDQSSWAGLNTATAALLDPSILRMFVDSLTRSITRNESRSILEVEESDAGSLTPPPQLSTPASQFSSEGSSAPQMEAGDRFRRSTTNMSTISNQTGYDPTTTVSSTVMLRNVPYDARQRGVLSLVEDEGFKGLVDFFYAPLDFKSKNNLGYAFINFTTLDVAKDFFRHFDGKRVTSRPGWDKPLRVCWARVQGLEANVEHYRNSPVNEMPTEFKPMLFDEDGLQAPFPEPDMLRDESRRSAHLQRQGSTVRPRERRLQSQLSRGFLTPVNAGPSNTFALKTPQLATGGKKLFVGGLSPETSSEQLEDYLSRFGRVRDCHVLVDGQTGRSRCYGFCTFEEEESAQAALAFAKTHVVDGRGVVVRPYTSSQR